MQSPKLLIATFLSLFTFLTVASSQEKILYIVDSIPVLDEPEDENDIDETDIADVTVIKNKDSLAAMGYGDMDGAIVIFTKAYRSRPDDVKRIPSTKRMEKKNGQWYYHDAIYSGPFIDYYYSGQKQADGALLNGKPDGLRKMYFKSGTVEVEQYYKDGLQHGIDRVFYEDGKLKQKGEYVEGKEEGNWEMYFPNGQVKQKSTFKKGKLEGETTVYYSSGRVLAVERNEKGKSFPDKRLEKIIQAMKRGHTSYKEANINEAIGQYSKALEIDSTYAEAYFARGTVHLNNFKFDEAIADLDQALRLEPYMEYALANRAFARIRKYQFGAGRKLSEGKEVLVIASPDKPSMPAGELEKICSDLRLAIYLGDTAKSITEAAKEFCSPASSR